MTPERKIGEAFLLLFGALISGVRTMEVMLPPKGRDLRLDLFRGLANWVIFIAHIPNNVVAYFMLGTGRYGFSDGADMFVFISGYTLAFVYARMLVERGMVITATRIIRRAWQIYVAHVFLFLVYLVEIGYFGEKFGTAEHAASFNVKIFLDRPAEVLYEGLILKIRWCVRVRLFLVRGRELVAEQSFRLGDVPAAVAAAAVS